MELPERLGAPMSRFTRGAAALGPGTPRFATLSGSAESGTRSPLGFVGGVCGDGVGCDWESSHRHARIPSSPPLAGSAGTLSTQHGHVAPHDSASPLAIANGTGGDIIPPEIGVQGPAAIPGRDRSTSRNARMRRATRATWTILS